MYEDDPQDKVFDVLGEAVFGDHPLGRAIIGRAEVVGRHAGRPSCARSTAAATSPSNVVVAAAGVGRPRRARRAGPADDRRSARRSARRPRRWRCPAAPRPRRRFFAKETEQYHVCLGAPGHRPRRRAPLRAARARQHPRRHVVLAAVPGGAREARPGLQRLLVHRRPTRAPARSASTSARGPTTCRRRWRSSATELDRCCAERRHRRGARALQGERQGPRRAGARVDDRAHEPPRLVGAGRHAAADRRRGRRAHRRGHARRRRGAGRASCTRPSA